MKNVKTLKAMAIGLLMIMGTCIGGFSSCEASRYSDGYYDGYEDAYYDGYSEAYYDGYYAGRHDRNRPHRHHNNHDDKDVAAAAIVGALIGAAIASS